MKKLLVIVGMLMVGCSSTQERGLACHTKDQIFSHIHAATGNAKVAGVSHRGEETLGWKLAHVPAEAEIRRHGFEDKDWLHSVCGLTVDRFVVAAEPICCEHLTGVVLGFLRPDNTEYQMGVP